VFGIRGEFLRTELMLGSGDGWGLELGQGWGQVRKADVRDGDFRGGGKCTGTNIYISQVLNWLAEETASLIVTSTRRDGQSLTYGYCPDS